MLLEQFDNAQLSVSPPLRATLTATPSSNPTRDEFNQLDAGNDPFVHQDRQGGLLLESPIAAEPIRRQRLLESGDAQIGEMRSDFERRGFVVAAVRVDPHMSFAG